MWERNKIKYSVVLCVLAFFKLDVFCQNQISFFQNNDLCKLIKESIISPYIKPYCESDGRMYIYDGQKIWIDSIFLNIDNLPFQIETDKMPGICYYSDISFYNECHRQLFTRNSIYDLKHPVMCWSVESKIVGKYCLVLIRETLFEAFRRHFIKEIFKFAPLCRYAQRNRHYKVFEYDFHSKRWVKSHHYFDYLKLDNDIEIIISESLKDFINSLISNKIFVKDYYSAIAIDGIPVSLEIHPTKKESFWYNLISRLNLNFGIDLDWCAFVDANSLTKSTIYREKILNSSCVIFPQFCLDGDCIIVTLSYRQIDKFGHYDKLIAIGRHQYTLNRETEKWESTDIIFKPITQ